MNVNRDKGHRRSQAERSEATRAALIDAARRLFAAQGFAGTGREEIVEAAGVTRGALYHHFGSKEGLFAAVYETLEAEVMAEVVKVAMAGDDPLERLRFGAAAYLDAALDQAFQRVVMLDGPAVLSAEAREAVNEVHALGVVRETLREAIAAGQIDDQPVEPLAKVVVAALHEAVLYVARAANATKARREVGSIVDRLLDRL